MFAYGEYKFDNPIYIDGNLSYGVSNYTEKVPGLVSSEYSATTIGVNGIVGYNVTNAIDLYVGSKYLKISQKDYVDSIGQKVSVDDDNILTARFGGKYMGKGSTIVPMAYLELTYDVMSNDRAAVVNMANSSYQITGKNIDPLGVQAGFGIMSDISNWKLSLNYDIEWRPDFISHTGRIIAKYSF